MTLHLVNIQHLGLFWMPAGHYPMPAHLPNLDSRLSYTMLHIRYTISFMTFFYFALKFHLDKSGAIFYMTILWYDSTTNHVDRPSNGQPVRLMPVFRVLP